MNRREPSWKPILSAALLLLLSSLAPGSSAAQSTYSADVSALVPSVGLDMRQDTGSGLSPSNIADTGAGVSGAGGSASATARAGFQFVGVSAGATGSGDSATAFASALTRSEFSIVPDDPALWGTSGELLIALTVNGSTGVAFQPGSGGNASVSWLAQINGIEVGRGNENRINDQPVTGDLQLGTNLATISLMLGPQFIHSFDLTADVVAGAGTAANSVAAFNETFSWGGILELRDAEGALVPDFAAPGQDPGADWRSAWVPIPEPSTAMLAALGLLVLAARSPRKARSA